MIFNLAAALGAQLKHRPCEAYSSDMRVEVTSAGLYTYPDITIVCGKAEFEDRDEDTLLKGISVVEKSIGELVAEKKERLTEAF